MPHDQPRAAAPPVFDPINWIPLFDEVGRRLYRPGDILEAQCVVGDDLSIRRTPASVRIVRPMLLPGDQVQWCAEHPYRTEYGKVIDLTEVHGRHWAWIVQNGVPEPLTIKVEALKRRCLAPFAAEVA